MAIEEVPPGTSLLTVREYRDRSPEAGAPAVPSVDAALMAEALALVTTPYDHLEGLLARADALAESASTRRLPRITALARLARADVLSRSGQVVAGAQIARDVLRAATSDGDGVVAARAHALLSTGLFRLGAWAEAAPHAAEAVQLLDSGAPLAIQADHALILAMITNAVRAGPVSTSMFERADALARRLGDPAMIVANLNNLAWLLHESGEVAPAVAAVRELCSVADRAGHRLNASVLDTVAAVLLHTGEVAEAERLINSALHGEARFTDADSLAAVLLTHAEIRMRSGDLAAALAAAERCRDLARERPLTDCVGLAFHKTATIRAAMGDYREAYEAMVAYRAEWQRVHDERGEAVACVLHTLFDLDQARCDRERFRELAERDALTGLWNRRHLDRRMAVLLDVAGQGHRCTGVGLLDLDHFKRINDRFTHQVGDEVLRRMAVLLDTALEGDAFAARMGGEEFIVVLPDTDRAATLTVCEHLREAVAAHPWYELHAGLRVTVSIGGTVSIPGDTMSSLVRRADDYLYRSKRAGRNRVCVDPS